MLTNAMIELQGSAPTMTSLPQNAPADSPRPPSTTTGDCGNRSAAEDLYFRALDLIAAGEPAAAATLLRASIAIDPQFLDALHGLTRALQDSGHLDEAILIAHRLIALDPEDVLAHTRLSILYQAKGMVPEAEAESTRAKLLGWKHQLRESRLSTSNADPIDDPFRPAE